MLHCVVHRYRSLGRDICGSENVLSKNTNRNSIERRNSEPCTWRINGLQTCILDNIKAKELILYSHV